MLFWISTALSTTLSTIALVLAVIALRVKLAPRRAIRALQLETSEHDAEIANLTAKLKRLTARVSMRANREKRAGGDSDGQNVATAMQEGETPAEWKARMRRVISQGRMNG